MGKVERCSSQGHTSPVMDFTDLRVLEAVARHGSMDRAAAELCTVQSNVSGRIRALEGATRRDALRAAESRHQVARRAARRA